MSLFRYIISTVWIRNKLWQGGFLSYREHCDVVKIALYIKLPFSKSHLLIDCTDHVKMFTETQTRDRFQWLKPLCVLGEYETGQDKPSPLFCSSPLEGELLLLSLWGTRTAEELCAHTCWMEKSKREGAEQGLGLQRLPQQSADRASNRQNHLYYRPLHGQHCVQREWQFSVKAPSAPSLTACCAWL